ncbi:MAG: PQQ-binding-like beta-propeller repeat protein [Acidobacteria bacterium]|nr:PQQ-binding-like beta-propeller repeat protein [Acidobacteriota bacterium]
MSNRPSRRLFAAVLTGLLLVAVPALAAFAERWSVELDKGVAGGLAADGMGRVFATVQKNSGSLLHAFDADGSALWEVKRKDTLAGVAMSADESSVIVAGHAKSGKIVVEAFDPATGDSQGVTSFNPANNYKARDGAFVSVSDKTGVVYVAAPIRKSGVCCAYMIGQLDADGTLQWNHRTGSADGATATVASIGADPKGKGVFVSGSALVDGVDTPFMARYAADGSEKWRTFRDPTSTAAGITVSNNGKKIFLFNKKPGANFFEVGLFNNKGKSKWLRPLLLTGSAGSRGSIQLSDNGKLLYMVASVLDNSFAEHGFMMRTDTKTSGPMIVRTESEDATLSSWFRHVALDSNGEPVVFEQRFNVETGAQLPPNVIAYDE